MNKYKEFSQITKNKKATTKNNSVVALWGLQKNKKNNYQLKSISKPQLTSINLIIIPIINQ